MTRESGEQAVRFEGAAPVLPVRSLDASVEYYMQVEDPDGTWSGRDP